MSMDSIETPRERPRFNDLGAEPRSQSSSVFHTHITSMAKVRFLDRISQGKNLQDF